MSKILKFLGCVVAPILFALFLGTGLPRFQEDMERLRDAMLRPNNTRYGTLTADIRFASFNQSSAVWRSVNTWEQTAPPAMITHYRMADAGGVLTVFNGNYIGIVKPYAALTLTVSVLPTGFAITVVNPDNGIRFSKQTPAMPADNCLYVHIVETVMCFRHTAEGWEYWVPMYD